MENYVESVLKNRFPSIDPLIVKDYLVQWICYLVINEKSATYDDLCCQVGQIIEFSVRQKEFFTQFGLTVIPLFSQFVRKMLILKYLIIKVYLLRKYILPKIMMLSEKKSCNNSMRS